MSETFNPGFPVHVYQDGMELPKEGVYFVVAGNGLWMHKDTGIVRAFVQVENISVLPDLDTTAEAECRLAKIPQRLVWRIKNFFRMVVEKYHAESEVNLYYNKATQEFRVHIPEQRVSHSSVHYKRIGTTHMAGMEDFLCVGTIHSHCDFNAFHSGTDIGDEESFDGLHCTFGNNHQDDFTITACVVVNGFRSKIDPMSVLDGINKTGHLQNDYYKLASIESDTAEEWSEDLTEWLSKVNGVVVDPNIISKGDSVNWAGDLNSVQIKTICGEGPFEVISSNHGKLTIATKVGKAKFSSKLFRKS